MDGEIVLKEDLPSELKRVDANEPTRENTTDSAEDAESTSSKEANEATNNVDEVSHNLCLRHSVCPLSKLCLRCSPMHRTKRLVMKKKAEVYSQLRLTINAKYSSTFGNPPLFMSRFLDSP